jgi:hypothetical protein
MAFVEWPINGFQATYLITINDELKPVLKYCNDNKLSINFKKNKLHANYLTTEKM